MQAVSGTLRAAIDARVRRLRGELLVDWNKDGYGTTIDELSRAFGSIEVVRELVSDLPDDVKLSGGHVAGSLTARFATPGLSASGTTVDPRMSARGYFGPYRFDSPLSGSERRSRPTRARIYFSTTAGDEPVPWFVGKTVEVAPEQEPLIQALDGWADAGLVSNLPTIIGDDQIANATAKRPRLWADFIVDYLFRRLGYYASPPQRTNCVFSATYHGSAFAEVGSMNWISDAASDDPFDFPPNASAAYGATDLAKFHRAIITTGTLNQHLSYFLAPSPTISTNDGQKMRIEGWHRFTTTSADQPFFILYDLFSGAYAEWVSAFWQTSTGRLFVLSK